MPMEQKRIYIAGHAGFLGSHFVDALRQTSHQLLLAPRSELDLRVQSHVDTFFEKNRPQIVILCAGRVGGIAENRDNPVSFLTENLQIQLNALQAAYRTNVEKFLFIGSSCMYPKYSPQPMPVKALLTGKPESTSLPHAIAKFAGLHTCLAYNHASTSPKYIPIILNNAYGPRANFHPQSSHFLPAMIYRIHHAKTNQLPSVTLWGTGNPRRECVFASDVVEASMLLLRSNTSKLELPINVGVGKDHSIREIAEEVKRIIGYEGTIVFDRTMPDGVPRKLLEISPLLKLGWKPSVELSEGIAITYKWYLRHGNVL